MNESYKLLEIEEKEFFFAQIFIVFFRKPQ